MEQSLKPISGVVDLSVRLVQDRVGEVEISCVPEELDLDKVKTAVSAASGPRHKFVVLSVIEEHD